MTVVHPRQQRQVQRERAGRQPRVLITQAVASAATASTFAVAVASSSSTAATAVLLVPARQHDDEDESEEEQERGHGRNDELEVELQPVDGGDGLHGHGRLPGSRDGDDVGQLPGVAAVVHGSKAEEKRGVHAARKVLEAQAQRHVLAGARRLRRQGAQRALHARVLPVRLVEGHGEELVEVLRHLHHVLGRCGQREGKGGDGVLYGCA